MAEGVNEFKDLTLIYESVAACPLRVTTDMPGAAMGNSFRSITMPLTTTRTERTFPLDVVSGAFVGLLDGKLIQFLFSPTAALKLISGSIRFRRIGEYVDGTLNEVWQTQALALG